MKSKTKISIAVNAAPEEDIDTVTVDDSSMRVLPLRNEVIFPQTSAPVMIGRESTLLLVNDAVKNGEAILALTQKEPNTENPGSRDLYHIGVICKVIKVLELPDGSSTALLAAGNRARLVRTVRRKPYLRAQIEPAPEIIPSRDDEEMLPLLSLIHEAYIKVLDTVGKEETREVRFALKQFDNYFKEFNFMCANSPIEVKDKMQLLDTSDMKERALLFYSMLKKALHLMQIKAELQNRTHEDLTRQQREHFLHQQIRTIQDELGGSVEDQEMEELRKRADKKKWSDAVRKHFDKELHKLERYNAQNPEYSIQYGYLETLLNLPWEDYSDEDFSLQRVQEVLDRDHFGLEKVKERIVEQMAVLKLRKDMKAPILCLYGPPGVGKTSLGRSIADALGREYARVSLGALHDEAEIRGHRRTYIGAMPGRILSSLVKAGKGNPVFVLDEIDKLGKDFKGDPSSALLEVLDPEQNSHFHDNYVDYDYDLSKVLFLATANDLSGISRPLLDRMELIEINGYATEEKVEIGHRHLVARALEDHGFEQSEIEITKDALKYIAESYTRESGVRQLAKRIAGVLRKVARKKASGENYPKVIDKALVREFLGPEEVTPDAYETNEFTGVVTGLAWTQVGGEILFIEASLAPGKGEKLTLTGNLGDVMKESAVIALQYLKSHAEELDIDPESFSKYDVHIHVPEGAIPKDGPSAGITMLTALASAFTGRKVREKVAMTGEITLRGKVLPIGGLKEKLLAAKRAGITEVVLCAANRKDVDKIEKVYLEGLNIHYVERMKEVIDFALLP